MAQIGDDRPRSCRSQLLAKLRACVAAANKSHRRHTSRRGSGNTGR
jgi:hypothetical protein